MLAKLAVLAIFWPRLPSILIGATILRPRQEQTTRKGGTQSQGSPELRGSPGCRMEWSTQRGPACGLSHVAVPAIRRACARRNCGNRQGFRGRFLPWTGEAVMLKLKQFAVRFLAQEDGPTAVEYAVMLALIIVVCIAAITALGSNASNTFSYVGNKVATTSS